MNGYEKIVGLSVNCPLCGGPMTWTYNKGPDGIEGLTYWCLVQGCKGRLDGSEVRREVEEPSTCVKCGNLRPAEEMSAIREGWCIDCQREEAIQDNVRAYEKAVGGSEP